MTDGEEIAHCETQVRDFQSQLADLQSGNDFEADLIDGQRVGRTQAQIAQMRDQIARRSPPIRGQYCMPVSQRRPMRFRSSATR